jgi:tRNA(Ile)-lysidine synthase
MLSRVLHTIETERLFDPGDRVLCAVSGGPDSTALLHALARLGPLLSVTLGAAVVDHGLRAQAAAEAQAVAGSCRALGFGCQILTVDVRSARRAGESLMTAARRVRLDALEQSALRGGWSKIALGHTADDQAETVLFRIVRGTGVRGLCGIPYRRGPYVRPLLDVERRQVLAFLGQIRIPYLEDPSNRDRRFARSRVRHEWLPFLAAENPRIVQALLRLSRQARAGDRRGSGPRDTWPGDVWVSGKAEEIITRLAAQPAGTKWVSLPDAVAEICYGRVTFKKRSDAEPHRTNWPSPSEPIRVPAPGAYRWAGGSSPAEGTTVELMVVDSPGGPSRAGVTFDRTVLEQELVLRGLKAGDRMHPRGGVGSRKLQDLLVDAKIPRGQRGRLPVLAAGGGAGPILFVPGLRPSEEGRPRPGEHPWIEVRVDLPGSG